MGSVRGHWPSGLRRDFAPGKVHGESAILICPQAGKIPWEARSSMALHELVQLFTPISGIDSRRFLLGGKL